MAQRYFASLTTQEALCVAISVEVRNARLYRQYADLFGSFRNADSQEIALVFREMAEEEHGHEAELRARYAHRFGDEACDITADEISDLIELPQVADGNIFAIARAGAAPVPASQALAVAYAAETGAYRFYRRLAEVCNDPEIAMIYAELARFEAEHVEKMRFRLEIARAIASSPQQA
jgi:rubrerythrin